MSSEPPEEPQRRSEPSALSPASPKPIHFPAPAHIPVLEMQMDVGFNQTEAHMNDPAMHNTEIRPGSWQDATDQPDEQQQQPPPKDVLQLDGTAEDLEDMMEEDVSSADAPGEDEEEDTLLHQQENGDRLSNKTPAVGSSAQSSLTVSQPPTVDDNAPHDISNATQAHPDADTPMLPSSAAAAAIHQAAVDSPLPQQHVQQDATHGAVDVQSMLATLQEPPQAAADTTINTNAGTSTAPVPDGLTVATTVSPSSSAQTPVAAPGVTLSPLSASNLGLPPSGLPPRPPPQEQPLIHPDYVHSQHIRDYHPHAAHSAHQPHVQNGTTATPTDASSRAAGPVAQSPSSTTSPQQPNASNILPFLGSESPAANGAGLTTPITATTQQPADGSPFVDPGANSGLAPPTQQTSQPNTPVENSRRERAMASGEYRKPEDRPWNADTQRKYDQFLEDERRYVNEGRWEQFPRDSRLFIGNLSSERVTKRDIFHVFHIYGELAQISIKQAFGFVQFLRADACAKALEMEQGTPIRDKKINLEVSKPQNNRNKPARARSRSPDNHGHGRSKGGSNVDRYVSSQRNSGGGGGSGGARGSGGGGSGGDSNFRGRSYRSPSPRGYRDRYDDRRRKRSYSRSRSRSPRYGRGGGGGSGGGRYRSPSPRRNLDDNLPLPRREPSNVPDVQIIVLDQLDRDFVAWVESAFATRGIRVDSLLLSSRLSEQAVVRRQIVEGVLAVSKLTRSNQAASKIGLQIFDRRAGANNVSFEEYDNLDPSICAELVLRAKATHPPSASYGGGGQQYPPAPFQQQQQPYNMYGSAQSQQPQFYGHQQQGYPPHQQQHLPPQPSSYYPGQPQQQQRPNNQTVPPNLQHLITNLDSAGLQNLLSAMNPQSGGTTATTATAHSPFPPTGSTAASASAAAFLRPPLTQQQQQPPPPRIQHLQQHQQQQQGQQQGQQGQQSALTSPTSAGTGPGQQVNMQEILARLATYK